MKMNSLMHFTDSDMRRCGYHFYPLQNRLLYFPQHLTLLGFMGLVCRT